MTMSLPDYIPDRRNCDKGSSRVPDMGPGAPGVLPTE